MAERVLRPHALDLLLGGDRRADWDVLGGDAELLELLVEGHDLVADQGGEHHIGLERGDLVDVGRELGVPERRILLGHGLAAVEVEQGLPLAVGLLGIDVVGADEIVPGPELVDHPGCEVVELLVGYGAGVKAVVAAFLRLVEGRIQQDAVVVLKLRQHRLAAG